MLTIKYFRKFRYFSRGHLSANIIFNLSFFFACEIFCGFRFALVVNTCRGEMAREIRSFFFSKHFCSVGVTLISNIGYICAQSIISFAGLLVQALGVQFQRVPLKWYIYFSRGIFRNQEAIFSFKSKIFHFAKCDISAILPFPICILQPSNIV